MAVCPENNRSCLGTYVVLALGTRWAVKMWPVEYFAELTGMIVHGGKRVVVTGGPGDVLLGAKISECVPEVTNLMGKTSLRELGALIQHCEVLSAAISTSCLLQMLFKNL